MTALAALALFAGYEFAEVLLTRISTTKDGNGRYAPPYRRVEATLQLTSRPAASAALTLLPIGVDLPPIAGQVARAEKAEGCSSAAWAVALQPLTRPDLLSAPSLPGRAPEMPFDAIAIYPAAPAARSLPVGSLKPPAGVRRQSIQAAVDLDGDAAADLLFVRFCSRPAGAALSECDYTVTEYWLRTAATWRRVRRSNPC